MPSPTMQQLGQRMYDNGVREVIFVHGTAVGNDPLDIFNSPILSEVNEVLPVELFDIFKAQIKNAINNTLGDVGNYSPDYVENFKQHLQDDRVCKSTEPFLWGSGNSHIARLKGAVDLAARLAETINTKPIKENERILLIGHSHAGQLFALLTIFLEGGNVANELLAFAQAHNLGDRKQLEDHLNVIKTIFLDFVTFGTPVRYKWGKPWKNDNDTSNVKRFQLLPIINHRKNSRLNLKAIYNVEDGDYVQQWGTEGTNLPNLNHAAEDELSKILHNAGFDFSVALANAAKSSSNNPVGRQEILYLDGNVVAPNKLEDYGDNRRSKDDDDPLDDIDPFYCVKKVFGHGVYTTKEKMYFNTKLIADHFYKTTRKSQ